MENRKSYFQRIIESLRSSSTNQPGQPADAGYEADKDGFFFYTACDNCNYHLRLRVTRSYDLERQEGGGYVWNKTIVDGRCFRKMQATVLFDNAYRVLDQEIEGGRFVSRLEWEENR